MEGEQPQIFSGKESNLGIEKPPSEMLKDLVLRWFSEDQAPLLSRDGTLPGWFHGFITRKQTEELLKDKDFGCFLIRLRERAFGYILSYRGKDRCRHFVISCQKNGRYVVSGDTRNHESLAELIRYYQMSEIEPFGETLTTACSKPEEKNIYDEISLDQRTPAKQSPELVRPGSGGSTTASPAGKDIIGQQSTKSRRTLQMQQKSWSKERQGWSLEANPEYDPEASPPIPDRSSSLMAEYSEEDSGNKATVYTTVRHLRDGSLEEPADVDQASLDRPPNLDDPAQGNLHRQNMSLKLSDKLYSQKNEEVVCLGTMYAEISKNQPKSPLTQPKSQNSQPFSLSVPKKSGLNSPSTPPRLSPKLPDKSKITTDSRGPQEMPLGSHSTSPTTDERRRMLSPSESFSDSPRENMYGQIHKLKSQKPTASVGDDPYERIPFEWPKRRIHERDSESRPKSSVLTAKGVYEQACAKSRHSSGTQSYPENAYEKIPAHLSKSSSTRHAGAGDNVYEKIHYVAGKGAGLKPSQKNNKPRRFLFADKKTKF